METDFCNSHAECKICNFPQKIGIPQGKFQSKIVYFSHHIFKHFKYAWKLLTTGTTTYKLSKENRNKDPTMALTVSCKRAEC